MPYHAHSLRKQLAARAAAHPPSGQHRLPRGATGRRQDALRQALHAVNPPIAGVPIIGADAPVGRFRALDVKHLTLGKRAGAKPDPDLPPHHVVAQRGQALQERGGPDPEAVHPHVPRLVQRHGHHGRERGDPGEERRRGNQLPAQDRPQHLGGVTQALQGRIPQVVVVRDGEERRDDEDEEVARHVGVRVLGARQPEDGQRRRDHEEEQVIRDQRVAVDDEEPGKTKRRQDGWRYRGAARHANRELARLQQPHQSQTHAAQEQQDGPARDTRQAQPQAEDETQRHQRAGDRE